MPKLRTTVNLDESLLEEVRESGVRNVSKYLENLMRRDLRGVEKVGKGEARRVQKLLDKLETLEEEWLEYMKKKEGKVNEIQNHNDRRKHHE